MKAAHSPAELTKAVLAFAGIIGFFVIVVHQLTRMFG
jgi:preprotein translocase subunit Sss1